MGDGIVERLVGGQLPLWLKMVMNAGPPADCLFSDESPVPTRFETGFTLYMQKPLLGSEKQLHEHHHEITRRTLAAKQTDQGSRI